MVTVSSLPQAAPATGRPYTWADLEVMPDDGRRYEIIDGALIVTPAPRVGHQRVSIKLTVLLHAACPPDLELLYAPLDVALTDDTVMQPDLLVARKADFEDRGLVGRPPLLAVEILSPSTRRIDLHLKKARLEAAGCPSYWVVDPDVPSITVWELEDGAYMQAAAANGDESCVIDRPFPVEIVPSSLVS